MSDVLADFRKFILRGNMLDLAVAVVVGVAFTAVITALVRDLITPLIGAIGGSRDFSSLTFTIHHSTFRYGDFLNYLISFVVVVTAIFFLVVMPVNALVERARQKPPADPTTKRCPECLSEIPLEARRCAYCTSELARGPEPA
jgi:large conductance mechanosensitive channel